MNKKELISDLYTLFKKHKIYLKSVEDEISLVDGVTNKPIISYYYMVDTLDLNLSLWGIDMEDELNKQRS